jgi:hypothetical protein
LDPHHPSEYDENSPEYYEKKSKLSSELQMVHLNEKEEMEDAILDRVDREKRGELTDEEIALELDLSSTDADKSYEKSYEDYDGDVPPYKGRIPDISDLNMPISSPRPSIGMRKDALTREKMGEGQGLGLSKRETKKFFDLRIRDFFNPKRDHLKAKRNIKDTPPPSDSEVA